MVSNGEWKSDNRAKAKMSASAEKKETVGRPVRVLKKATEPGVQQLEVPLDFKVKTLFVNIGRAFGKVVHWYSHLTEVSSDDVAERYRTRGMAEFEKGLFADAAEDFAALVELQPADCWANYMLGRSLGKTGDVAEGIARLRMAAELDHGDPEIDFQLGLLLSHEEQLEEAEAAFSKVATQAPAEPKGHYRLGIVYDKMGEYNKAVESLHRALELRPQSPKINQRLGFVYEGKGDHAQALKYFKKAAELENSIL